MDKLGPIGRTCRICESAGNDELYTTTERMFGLGGAFTYFRCSCCGCLQIDDPSIDVSTYYPANYYSYSSSPARRGPAQRLMQLRDEAAVFGTGMLGRALLARKPNPPLEALSHVNMRRDMRVGDVGCGAGHLLRSLRGLGFQDLTGIDPHIAGDITVDANLRIRKAALEQVAGPFDLLMFHHSLEHIPDQSAVLKAACERLAPAGVCLVRVPLVSSYAWRTYSTDWVQLDAPRHLYLHSTTSFERLAGECGLQVAAVVFDSTEFQFWGSEALRRGIPLVDKQTGHPDAAVVDLARRGRRRYAKLAKSLNLARDGDQAIFILRRRDASS